MGDDPDGPDRSPVAGPVVSVVVVAHGRKAFLLGAVRSVRAQAGLPAGAVEILVVKDFADRGIDDALDREGVGHLETEEGPLGSKIALGVARTRAPLVAFLEDDDEFVPGRLRRVVDLFERDPELGYYRNGQRRIDAEGRDLPAAAYGAAHHHLQSAGPRRIAAAQLPKALPWLRRTDPDFNLSSMVVRREVLVGLLPSLRGREAAIDSSVFYAALSRRVALWIDPEPLTRYRVHGTNVSLWAGTTGSALADRQAYLERFLASFGQILHEVDRTGPDAARQLAGSTYFGSRILYRVLSGAGGRAALVGDLRRLAGYPKAAPFTVRPDIPAWGIAALLSPQLARAAFRQRRSRESRSAQ